MNITGVKKIGSLLGEGLTGTDLNDLLISRGPFNGLNGLLGDDWLIGCDGQDDITDSGGHTSVNAGGGNDSIVLTGGTFVVFDGAGRDRVICDGNGRVFADVTDASGNDSYRMATATPSGALSYRSAVYAITIDVASTGGTATGSEIGSDTVAGFAAYAGGRGGDTISLAVDGTSAHGNAGMDKLYGMALGLRLDGGLDSDLIMSVRGKSRLFGGEGDDEIKSMQGGDLIWGGEGNDTITTGSSKTTVWDGPGGDTVSFGGSGTLLADTTSAAGQDVYSGRPSAAASDIHTTLSYATATQPIFVSGHVVQGVELGTDTAFLFSRIIGGSGNDVMQSGPAPSAFVGGGGNDTLCGNAFNDTLNGGDGRDTLRHFIAGGNDVMTGGADADIFDFNLSAPSSGGRVILTDFEDGVDHLFAVAGLIEIRDTAAGALLQSSYGAFIYLRGITLAQIDQSDFV